MYSEEAPDGEGNPKQAWARHAYATLKDLKRQDCFRLMQTDHGPTLLTDAYGAEMLEHVLDVSVRPSNLATMSANAADYRYVVDLINCPQKSGEQLAPLVQVLDGEELLTKFLKLVPAATLEPAKQETPTAQR